MNRSSPYFFPFVSLILVAFFSTAVPAQELEWVTRAGGSGFSDEGRAIAVDADGNTYLTGEFSGSATFGAGEPNQTTLTTSGSFDLDFFLAKYDPNGMLLSAKRAGGSTTEQGSGIAVDTVGNSYVIGRFFSSSAVFGPGEANETTLNHAGSGDIFVAKYDPNGMLLWAKRAGGSLFDQGNGIAVDAAGNSYATGGFHSSGVFGPGEANETTLTSVGGIDIFVAKYDSTGTLLWAKAAGGSFFDQGADLAVDAVGNSYVIGNIPSASATFGPGEANETTLTTAGSFDIFLAKYDPNGMLLWAKRAGGSALDQGTGVAVDAANNSYLSGTFQGSATFGPTEANETTLTSTGGEDIFVARYDSAGVLQWAKRAGGSESDRGVITADTDGTSHITGGFGGSATFGPGEANETTLTSAGGRDVFVAKYDPNGMLLFAKRAGGPDFDQGLHIAVDSGGKSYATGEFSGSAIFGSGETNETTLTSAGNTDIFVAKFGAANTAPTVTLNGPTSVNEGQTETYSWTVTDPDAGDTFFRLVETCGTNGTLSGSTFSNGDPTGNYGFDCTFPDGPATSDVEVQVEDSAMATSNLASITVNVVNVAPTITGITKNHDPIFLGEDLTITVSASDVPADTLQYEFDCDNDSSGTFEIGPQMANSHACVAASFVVGTNTVNVRVTDDDGGTTQGSTILTVLTPEQAIESLGQQVKALVPPLNGGQAESLVRKLEEANSALARGQNHAAKQQLIAFINEVTDLIATGILTPAQGQALIDWANRVINVI